MKWIPKFIWRCIVMVGLAVAFAEMRGDTGFPNGIVPLLVTTLLLTFLECAFSEKAE